MYSINRVPSYIVDSVPGGSSDRSIAALSIPDEICILCPRLTFHGQTRTLWLPQKVSLRFDIRCAG